MKAGRISKRSDKYWFHIWNGLIAEAKHEKKLGKSVWLYLWLLAMVDRDKGELITTHRNIADNRECTLPAVRWRLNVLKTQGYITTEDMGNCTKITITKWRSINGKKENWAKRKQREMKGETNGT